MGGKKWGKWGRKMGERWEKGWERGENMGGEHGGKRGGKGGRKGEKTGGKTGQRWGEEGKWRKPEQEKGGPLRKMERIFFFTLPEVKLTQFQEQKFCSRPFLLCPHLPLKLKISKLKKIATN